MEDSMLYAANVHIDRQILVCLLSGNQLFVILGVHIAQEIPGRPGPLGHGVGFPLGRASTAGTGGIDPFGMAAKGDSPVPVG